MNFSNIDEKKLKNNNRLKNALKKFIWVLYNPQCYNHIIDNTSLFVSREKDIPNSEEWCEINSISTYEALEHIFPRQIQKGFFNEFDILHRYSSYKFNIYKKESTQRKTFNLTGAGNLDLLYNICENLRPKVVLETGVAYGWSSLSILSSIVKNKRSILVSTDLPYYAYPRGEYQGSVVPPFFSSRWVLIRNSDRYSIPPILSEIDSIDLFHYDSDKSYNGRIWAYNYVWDKLRKGGILVSDDINDNYAFRDFSKFKNKEPIIVKTYELISINGSLFLDEEEKYTKAKYVGLLIR